MAIDWKDIDWGELDYLVIDLPPGTSDAALTVMQSLPLKGILLVTSPQDLAGMVVRKAANMANHLNIPMIGLIENMSYLICPGCNTRVDLFGTSRTFESAMQISIPLIGRVPLDTNLSILCDKGSIEDYQHDVIESVTNQVIKFVSQNEKELA